MNIDELEDIPLEKDPPLTPVDPVLLEASKQDFSAWEDAYKKLMGVTIGQFQWLLKYPHWNIILSSNEHEPFRLFEANISTKDNPAALMQGPYHCLKVTGVLRARAERVFYVIKDQDPDTRLKWDSEFMVSMCELQTFKTDQGDIKVVQSEIKAQIPMAANRISLGIQYASYNSRTRTHRLVFRTTQHWHYRIPEDRVPINGLVGVIVRALDPPAQPKGASNPSPMCEVIIIMYMNVGGNIPSPIVESLKEWLRERLHLYERVAIAWKAYYEGKDPRLLKNRK